MDTMSRKDREDKGRFKKIQRPEEEQEPPEQSPREIEEEATWLERQAYRKNSGIIFLLVVGLGSVILGLLLSHYFPLR